MTRLLEQAIERLRLLSETDQDAIASLVLSEIESEQKWDSLFTKAPQKIKNLADEAWGEFESGSSEELDPDKL